VSQSLVRERERRTRADRDKDGFADAPPKAAELSQPSKLQSPPVVYDTVYAVDDTCG